MLIHPASQPPSISIYACTTPLPAIHTSDPPPLAPPTHKPKYFSLMTFPHTWQ